MTVKDRIRSTVLELNKEKEIADITVSELANRVQISRSTFYNYYDDIYAVMEEMENELICGIQKILSDVDRYQFDKYSAENPSWMDVQIYEFVEKNREIYKVLYGTYGDPLFRKKVRKLKRNLIQKIVEDNRVDENYKDIVMAFLIGGLMDAVEEWIVHYPDIDAKTMERITSPMMYAQTPTSLYHRLKK